MDRLEISACMAFWRLVVSIRITPRWYFSAGYNTLGVVLAPSLARCIY
jgi:hypothetical protein